VEVRLDEHPLLPVEEEPGILGDHIGVCPRGTGQQGLVVLSAARVELGIQRGGIHHRQPAQLLQQGVMDDDPQF